MFLERKRLKTDNGFLARFKDTVGLESLLNSAFISNFQFHITVSGLDVIAQAQSGTGKTATFSIAILQKIDTGLRECQALILAPTRELAQQVIHFMLSLL